METALKTGDLDTAVSVGRAAASRFRRLDDYWGLSAILYHLGWGLRQFGRNDEGAHDLEEAIDVAASAGLFNTVQWALADLALVQLNLGRRDVARDLFDRADASSKHVGDGAGTVLAHYGHGLLALQDGDVDEAERLFRLARDGFATLRTPVWEGWALVTRGRCVELRGEASAARELHEAAHALGVRAGEPGLTASSLEGLARTWAAVDPERAGALDARGRRRTGATGPATAGLPGHVATRLGRAAPIRAHRRSRLRRPPDQLTLPVPQQPLQLLVGLVVRRDPRLGPLAGVAQHPRPPRPRRRVPAAPSGAARSPSTAAAPGDGVCSAGQLSTSRSWRCTPSAATRSPSSTSS